MTGMEEQVTNSRMSAVRALIRAGVLVATAWGLKFSMEQVVAIQLLTEAVLATIVQFTNDKTR